jgi:hypothetical protein
MKRKLLLFLMLLYCGLLFLSCAEIAYESNDRIAFEGYVKSQDGTPLADVPVATLVYLEAGQYGDSDKIAYTTTDANGHYTMVFPKPTNHDYITLSINGGDIYYYYGSTPDPNNILTQYSVTNILPDDLEPLQIDFGTTVLYRGDELTTLTIDFVTDGSVNDNFPITGYEGLFPNTGMYYSMPDFEPDPNYLLYISGWPTTGALGHYYYVLQDDGITYSRTFTVLRNQSFIFKYRNAENVETSVNIPIANEPVTYTVNY